MTKNSLYSLKAGKVRDKFHVVLPKPKRPVIVGFPDELDWVAAWVRRYFLDGQATYVAILTEPVPEYVHAVDGVAWAMRRGAFSLDEAIQALYRYQEAAEREGRGFIDDLKAWRRALAEGLGIPPEEVHDKYIHFYETRRQREARFLYQSSW